MITNLLAEVLLVDLLSAFVIAIVVCLWRTQRRIDKWHAGTSRAWKDYGEWSAASWRRRQAAYARITARYKELGLYASEQHLAEGEAMLLEYDIECRRQMTLATRRTDDATNELKRFDQALMIATLAEYSWSDKLAGLRRLIQCRPISMETDILDPVQNSA